MPTDRVNVLVAVPMPDECVAMMEAADPRARIIYDRTLIPQQRYVADRVGQPLEFTAAMETRWRSYLAAAEVILGFDRRHLAELPQLAPNLKWVQATSTGVGPTVSQLGWAQRGIVTTSASGIHSVPISEFVMMAMLCFTKDIFHLFNLKAQRRHERYCTGQLRGKTLGIVGLGTNGRQVARSARGLGMRVLATKRQVQGCTAKNLGVDALYAPEQTRELLGQCDFVVLTVPTTPETLRFMDEDMFRAMKPGSIFINNSMGTTVVQDDLIRVLGDGHLGGAALDVYEVEPVPADSPLWDMDNVLMSPHSASCAEDEDINMTRLFLDNLDRYLDGLPLRNVICPDLQY